MAPRNDQDQLTAAWRALAGQTDKRGWNVIEILRKRHCAVHAGRRAPENDESLLIGIDGDLRLSEAQFPRGQGFAVCRTDAVGGDTNRTWLAITRQPGGQLGLFCLMSSDLVDGLDKIGDSDGERIYAALISRIREWQEFMRRDRNGVLSAEEEIGLFGELSVMRDILESGAPMLPVLEAWFGPEDGLHDFVIGTGAIEVKTTTSPVGFIADIACLEQLDDSVRNPLYVACVRMAQVADGTTLPELCDELLQTVRDEAGAPRLLGVKLMKAGYLEMMRDQYQRRFVRKDLTFRLVRAGSPRLTRANVPSAVVRAKYSLDLEALPDVSSGTKAVVETLGVNATWS